MAIRSSRNRREIAIDLYKALREKPPEFQYRAALDNDPDKIAIEIRNFLNITQKIQSDFKTDYEALNWWRSALESQGILVFQASGVEVSEMRGFSISEGPLPAIVANIKDSPLARIFTLIHELVHIMLNDGGLCDLAETEHYHPDDEQIEIFSNRIAGAVLVPEGDLRTDKLVREKGREIWWTDNEISELANKFKVSREVLVRRLLICNLTTAEFYQQKRGELQVVKKTQGGFVPPYRKAISVSGAPFIRLVLANYYQENITSSDLSEFLDVKLQHVQKIEEEFMGRTIEFGAIP
jgi:Zn-dependent peptidase ImmA (M78 family)